ncbi:MAG: DUF1028 domain-containing protein [Candidatus Neomarinimicrobiota bacterium]|jgi:uncharacterized Ntn-hydrolase superfamily protein|nr:DUF1028 domain-containing protein [Candidatus Neomarinimicrobiota bacterium]
MKRFIFSFFLICLAFSEISPGARPVHTYSIVAFDPETGQLGVAVQSHWFSVGSLVPWAKAGVGAVATQSFVKVEYGPDGLKLMEQGFTANQALEKLVATDEGEAVRQVAMIDINGNVAAHTGNRCIYAAGDQQGKNYSVQANLMEHETVWPTMANAFENSSGDLADRMMAALIAAEEKGGDIRGKQSAAMLIVTGEPTGVPWKDKVLDLRIDDHPEPLRELRRLIRVHRAYQHANKGDLYVEHKEIEKALTEYKKATEFYPENPELPYWSAVTLADIGRVKEALPIFRDVFSREPRLRTLIPRLVKSGLLPDNNNLIDQIISIK